ncbi:ACP S-malonyltransferase [bacterium]|nr:ACP S-malonyltransferase [bacterium]
MAFAALFPGQGSQSVGMGKAFFDASDEAKKIFSRADEALGFSISKLCFEGPIDELTLTQNAQPAILLVSYLAFKLAGLNPVAAAGHSLGEYSALAAAGSLELEDALVLVNKRGKYMQAAVPAGAGKMIAVMGPTEEQIRQVLANVSAGVAEIANLNSPGQTVVSGDVTGVEQGGKLLKEAGAKIIPLNVSAPFHCSLMRAAADQLSPDLDTVAFKDPLFPIYANVTGKAVRSAADARKLLKDQVCASVRWVDCMQGLFSETGTNKAIEFGSGDVLAKLLKRINTNIASYNVDKPDQLQGLAQFLNA